MNIRNRALLLLAVLAVGLGSIACEYDYWFLAFEIECEEGDDRCYTVKEWHTFYCAYYMASPFEIWQGPYKFELDLDIPDTLPQSPFPKKAQFELVGYDMEGDRVFRERFKRWKFDSASGRIEEQIDIKKDLIVPYGGKLCVNGRTFGAEFLPGWKAGFLVEPIVETAD